MARNWYHYFIIIKTLVMKTKQNLLSMKWLKFWKMIKTMITSNIAKKIKN